MKKIFLPVIGVLLTAGLFAQSGISFGLRAIPTLNWVSPTDEDDSISVVNEATKIGIGFGPSVRYKFSDNFNMDLSAIFTWQKFGIDVTNQMPANAQAMNMTENFKVQYLQIPFNFNGQFDVANDLQALINFGVGTGVKLASYRMIEDHIDAGDLSDTYEKSGVLNFIDFYLTAGAGAVYNIEDNLHLSLTVQYNNGIIDGWLDGQNEEPSKIEDLSIKHKNVAFSLGFYIDL